MKFIQNLRSDFAINAFGWTLIHSLWQGTLLLIIAVASFYLLRRKSANLRYVAGVGFLVAQIIASVATFAVYYLKATPVAALNKSTTVLHYASSQIVSSSAYKMPFSFKVQMWISAHLNELVICWLIGAAFLLLRFAGGWIFTERLRLNAKIVMDREWRARFGVITAKMNITQSVEFRESARILTPMVIGAISPVVLIPIGLLSGFSTAQVEAILAHELAHIRRNDYLINMLQSFVEVIFFFHPAIWWLSDRVRAEREHCCDDIALAVCGDKMSLAHALVKVAEWQSAPTLAMAFASKKPLLLQRVQRVLGIQTKPTRTLVTFPVMLFALSLVIGVSLYAIAQKEDKKNDTKKVTKPIIKQRDRQVLRINEGEIFEVADIEPLEPVVEDIIDLEVAEVLEFEPGNDSLNKKIAEINKKMEAFQSEMEPFQRRMEEIHLEMEKQQFEVERFEREREKIEWKKHRASELRSELMEKRSSLFDRGDVKSNQSQKVNEADLEKQLADFEQQIKAQEQAISELNSQMTASRREELKAEEPVRKLEAEIRDLEGKIEEIDRKMEKESELIGHYSHDMTPRVARAPRSPRPARGVRAPAPPRAPAAVNLARPLKPAQAPAAPIPPAAPLKK